jgi:hypothetical protein
MFKIYKGGDTFFQWDIGQRLIVEDPEMDKIHFCNKTGECSLVCEVYEEDGLRLVNVPNILLQVPYMIRVYGCLVEGEDSYFAKNVQIFKVIARTKPEDYIYTEEELKNWNSFDERIAQIEEDIEEIEAIGLGNLARKTEVAAVSNRLDTIVAETTLDSDTEVKDIRVGADATVYESAGAAVRAKVNKTDIAQELGDSEEKVISQKLHTETIKNIQNGYVNLIPTKETYIEANTGIYKFNSNYTASQKIPCNRAKNIEIYVGSATRMCAFYSEDDSFVATLVLDAGVNVINVPDGATKFAVSATNEVFPTFLIKNTFFIYDDVLDETSDNTVKNKVIAKEMKELNDKFIATEKAVENSYPLLNLIDKSKASLNTSVVSANGNVVANTNWDLSDYIYLKPNTTYYGFGFYFENFYAFYDINKNFITEHGAIIEYGTNKYKGTITTGETALYIRVSLSHSTTYTNAYISEYEDKYYAYGEYDYSYVSIKHQEKIANIEASMSRADKKVLVIGDSISTDIYGNYKKWVSHLIDEGFFSAENTTNDSIHATGFVARLSGGENDFITRIKAIENKADYDLVIVFGGVNDYIQNIPFGESGGDEAQYFIPAVDYFFDYLVNNFTQARICVISPLRMFRNNANTAGKTQTEYADYIKQVAKNYSLPLLNATDESGFCPYIQAFKEKWTRFYVDSSYPDGIYDGLHPTEEYERKYLAPYIKSFIARYI